MEGHSVKEIISVVREYANFELENETEDTVVLLLVDREQMDVSTFKKILDKGNRLGFNVFTGGEGSNRIYISRKTTKGKNTLFSFRFKVLLASLTIITIFYSGYVYEGAYSGMTNLVYLLSYTTVFFVSPVIIILLSRELGRYLAYKTDGLKYSFPILIPDPIGLGTMGSIISQSSPFVSRRCMIKSGLYPLILGFGTSTIFLVAGFYLIGGPPLIPPVNTPVTRLSLPLIFSFIIYRFTPETVVLSLLSYAGWVGIIINSFNAFPAGYLDGGLIASAVTPTHARTLSYASIIVIAALSFVYPSWFIILVFILLIGIQGPNVLYTLNRLTTKSKVAILAALFFVIGGMVPIPVHITPANFSMSLNQNSYVLVNGTAQNTSVNVYIHDVSNSIIVPAFTINPGLTFSVDTNVSDVSPGNSGMYTLQLDTSGLNNTGFYHYSITAYSGSSEQVQQVTILVVNLSSELSFSQEVPFSYSGPSGKLVNLSFVYNSIGEKNISLFSFVEQSYNYSVKIDNLSFDYTGSVQFLDKSFTASSGVPIQISLLGNQRVSNWYIIAMTAHYNAAIAVISLI